MLDGMVAIASGKASARGEIVNDLPDRISDVIIFGGAAHSNWMHLLIGYWAAIFSLGTAYVGLLGQAVGVGRQFGGLMSKPWRMVALHLGAWITYALALFSAEKPDLAGLTPLDWACAIVIVGCAQSIALRLSRIFRALKMPND
jgi:phosphatidylglycerophosphate synthase